MSERQSHGMYVYVCVCVCVISSKLEMAELMAKSAI